MDGIRLGRVVFRAALFLWMTGSVGGGLPGAFGQEAEPEPLVKMNDVIAMAGQEVKLHVAMGRVPDSVRRLELELEMPAGQVRFVEFEPVYLAEKAGLQFSVLNQGPGRIRFAFTRPDSGEAGFPEDGLGFLVMKVLEETQPQALVVRPTEASLIGAGGELVRSASAAEAVINVVSPELYPLVSCFFYLH